MKLKDFLALIPNHPIDASGVTKPRGYCAEPSYGYIRHKNIFFWQKCSFCPFCDFFIYLFWKITLLSSEIIIIVIIIKVLNISIFIIIKLSSHIYIFICLYVGYSWPNGLDRMGWHFLREPLSDLSTLG